MDDSNITFDNFNDVEVHDPDTKMLMHNCHTCNACGALILDYFWEQHVEWHNAVLGKS